MIYAIFPTCDFVFTKITIQFFTLNSEIKIDDDLVFKITWLFLLTLQRPGTSQFTYLLEKGETLSNEMIDKRSIKFLFNISFRFLNKTIYL